VNRGLTIVVVLCAVLLGGSVAATAYDDHDYCMDIAASERVDCRALYLDAVSVCLSDRAFDLWTGFYADDPELTQRLHAIAESDFLICKADALAERRDCIANVDTCLEE
jgi:hypothetical protein